jgi:hypothetical protein
MEIAHHATLQRQCHLIHGVPGTARRAGIDRHGVAGLRHVCDMADREPVTTKDPSPLHVEQRRVARRLRHIVALITWPRDVLRTTLHAGRRAL